MNLAVIWLFLFDVYVFTAVSCTDTGANFVINTTSAINSSLDAVKRALRRYHFDPMVLIDADETNFDGIAVIKNGTLYGTSNVTVCGDWYLSFSGDKVRSGGRFCASEITGTFNYTDIGADSQFSECVLDIRMRDVTADMDVLYTQSEKSLSDPRVKVQGVGDTQMFLDKCAPDFQRIRLSKNLESVYETIIIRQAVLTSVELGKRADEEEPVLSFYNKYVAEMRGNRTDAYL